MILNLTHNNRSVSCVPAARVGRTELGGYVSGNVDEDMEFDRRRSSLWGRGILERHHPARVRALGKVRGRKASRERCVPPFPVLFTDLLNLLHSVDTSIGPFVSKTSVRHAVFLRKLEATLPKCVSYFCARTLKLSELLLSDNDGHIGLLPPSMLSGVDYKTKLEKLIIWNDTIGYSFFHTYASDGNVSHSLCYLDYLAHCVSANWLLQRWSLHQCAAHGAL